MDKPKIRFIDSMYKALFDLEDGEDVEIEITEGEWQRFKCRYIDETHFYLDNHVYHICEFAQAREKLVQRYRPAETLTEQEAANDHAGSG